MARQRIALTPAEALYVIDRLIADRTVSPALVKRLSGEMVKEMRELEQRLEMLRGGMAKPVATRRGPVRRALSPETLASRRLQGLYLNLIRRVPKRERARFKQIVQSQGREEAINALRKRLQGR
jgi:hypothetical protein